LLPVRAQAAGSAARISLRAVGGTVCTGSIDPPFGSTRRPLVPPTARCQPITTTRKPHRRLGDDDQHSLIRARLVLLPGAPQDPLRLIGWARARRPIRRPLAQPGNRATSGLPHRLITPNGVWFSYRELVPRLVQVEEVSDGRSNQVWTARGPHVLARADRATLNRINRLIDNACATCPPASASPNRYATCRPAPGHGGSATSTAPFTSSSATASSSCRPASTTRETPPV
jgi:hypothetical protein